MFLLFNIPLQGIELFALSLLLQSMYYLLQHYHKNNLQSELNSPVHMVQAFILHSMNIIKFGFRQMNKYFQVNCTAMYQNRNEKAIWLGNVLESLCWEFQKSSSKQSIWKQLLSFVKPGFFSF